MNRMRFIRAGAICSLRTVMWLLYQKGSGYYRWPPFAHEVPGRRPGEIERKKESKRPKRRVLFFALGFGFFGIHPHLPGEVDQIVLIPVGKQFERGHKAPVDA